MIFGLVSPPRQVFSPLSGFLPPNWESGKLARSEEKWSSQFPPKLAGMTAAAEDTDGRQIPPWDDR